MGEEESKQIDPLDPSAHFLGKFACETVCVVVIHRRFLLQRGLVTSFAVGPTQRLASDSPLVTINSAVQEWNMQQFLARDRSC